MRDIVDQPVNFRNVPAEPIHWLDMGMKPAEIVRAEGNVIIVRVPVLALVAFMGLDVSISLLWLK
jgi:hypothetical protein